MSVEEEDDLRIIDPVKLREQAELLEQAKDIVDEKEKLEDRLNILGTPSRDSGGRGAVPTVEDEIETFNPIIVRFKLHMDSK